MNKYKLIKDIVYWSMMIILVWVVVWGMPSECKTAIKQASNCCACPNFNLNETYPNQTIHLNSSFSNPQ